MTAVDDRPTTTTPDPTADAAPTPAAVPRIDALPRPEAGTPAVAVGELSPDLIADIDFKSLRSARRTATVINTVLLLACLTLSFYSLWNLASRTSSWPAWLAWLWPLLVDGPIIVAHFAIRATAKSKNKADKQFFWALLISSAVVSIGGNGLHALLPKDQPLSPWLCVVMGCIPACALLATTNAAQRLSRMDTRPPAPVDPTAVIAERAAELAEQREQKWHAVAAGIHERGQLTNQSTGTLVEALTLLFEVKPTPSLRSIATQIGVPHHDIVGRIRDAALVVLNETAAQ